MASAPNVTKMALDNQCKLDFRNRSEFQYDLILNYITVSQANEAYALVAILFWISFWASKSKKAPKRRIQKEQFIVESNAPRS
jgi:hypothetical protein